MLLGDVDVLLGGVDVLWRFAGSRSTERGLFDGCGRVRAAGRRSVENLQERQSL